MHEVNIARGKSAIISVRNHQGRRCVFKKIYDPLDLSFRLEVEASRRMQECDQIYTVVDVLWQDGQRHVVSEYVEGEDLTQSIPGLSEDQLVSVACQVLLLIYLLNVSGISHNDIHCNNIRVQKTETRSLRYFCAGRRYEIETHGVKAVIIDFGAAFITDHPESSALISGDSFMRLDVRYDVYRFLKSFTDCLRWKRIPHCAGLVRFVDEAVTRPLRLGLYGVPDAYINLAPRLFNQYLRSLYPSAAKVDSTVAGILHSWPKPVLASRASVEQASELLRTMDRDAAREIADYVLLGVKSTAAKKLKPLVMLWQRFVPKFVARVSAKIVFDFDNKTIVQEPLAMVDWLIVGRL